MVNNFNLEKISKVLVSIFLFSILFWDYTIVYKIVLVALTGIVAILFFNGKKIIFSPFFAGYGVFTFYCLLHTLLGFSISTSNSLEYCQTLLMNTAMIFILTNVIGTKKDILLMIKVFIFSSLIGTIYIFVYGILHGEISTVIPYLIFDSAYYSHNDIPLISTISIAFILYLYVSNKTRYKKYLFILPLFIILVPISGARKSFILLLLILFYFYVFFSKEKRIGSRLIRILIISAAISVVFTLCFTNDF